MKSLWSCKYSIHCTTWLPSLCRSTNTLLPHVGRQARKSDDNDGTSQTPQTNHSLLFSLPPWWSENFRRMLTSQNWRVSRFLRKKILSGCGGAAEIKLNYLNFSPLLNQHVALPWKIYLPSNLQIEWVSHRATPWNPRHFYLDKQLDLRRGESEWKHT